MMMDDGFSLVSMRFAVDTDASDNLLRKVVESSVSSTGVEFSKGTCVGSDFSCDMTKALPYVYRAMFIGDGAKTVDADDFAAKFVRFARVMGMTSGAARLEIEDADIILSTLGLDGIWASAAANRPIDGNVVGKSHVMDGRVVSDSEFIAEMAKASAAAMEKKVEEARDKAKADAQAKVEKQKAVEVEDDGGTADTGTGDSAVPDAKADAAPETKATVAADPAAVTAVPEDAATTTVDAIERQVSETVAADDGNKVIGTVSVASVPAYAVMGGVSEDTWQDSDGIGKKPVTTKADALIRDIEQSAERTDESVATVVDGIDIHDLD